MSIILIIIIITSALSLLAFRSPEIMSKWIFKPYDVKYFHQYYRFITSGFLHADWMHLFFNMFVFYSFGQAVLTYYNAFFDVRGTYYFILLYLGGMIVADLPTYIKHHEDQGYASLGASGAVSAVLFAFIVFNPLGVIALWGIIKFPAVVWGVIYLVYSYWASHKQRDHINHDAHFYGAVFGIGFTILLKPILVTSFIQQLMTIGRSL